MRKSRTIAILIMFFFIISLPTAFAQTGRNDYLKKAFSGVTKKVYKSIVGVYDSKGGKKLALGTIIKGGYVLTCDHSTKKQKKLFVKLIDGSWFATKKVARDEMDDIVLLKVKGLGGGIELSPVKLGDSKKLKIAEWVISIGNTKSPLAVGLVSITKREVMPKEKMKMMNLFKFFMEPQKKTSPNRYYPEIIQHDSPVKDALLGGPIVNSDGKMVGINVSSVSRGKVYAVPVNRIRKALKKLIKGEDIIMPEKYKKLGKVKLKGKGFIGVQAQDITPKKAKELGIKGGVQVVKAMDGFPAKKAGLKANDIIYNVDGKDVKGMLDLIEIVSAKKVGDKIKVKVFRGKEKKTFEIEIGERPKSAY